MDRKVLEYLLESHGVDYSKWGQGSAKTVDHLVGELLTAESKLFLENHDLVLGTEIVTALVVYVPRQNQPAGAKQTRLRLVEDRQVFNDGRVRMRGGEGGSITEKLKYGETGDLRTLARAMREELGFASVDSVEFLGTTKKEEDSQSYPGLWSRFTQHRYEVRILDKDFDPKGYREVQEDKTTYFVWRDEEA